MTFILCGGFRYLKGGMGFPLMEDHYLGRGTWKSYNETERRKQLSKAVIGTTVMSLLFYLTGDDDDDGVNNFEKLFGIPFEITANGTGDWSKNKQLLQQGWMPYSIRIGDKYIGYQYTPLVMILSPIGFFRDAQKYNDEYKDEDLLKG